MPHQGPVATDIRAMFDALAPTYDALNRALSFGIDQSWRRRAVTESARPGDAVVDVATGTGDLAAQFARAVGPAGHVVGVDFCLPFLERAPAKLQALDGAAPASFAAGDALRLPFADGRFDVASIAFGIRNVADPVACLRELARVVRPGGNVVVLELGQAHGAWGALFSLYSRAVLAPLGGLVSRSPRAYRYLVESSARFPAGARFEALMQEAGCFSSTRALALTGGVCGLYVGVVGKAGGAPVGTGA